MFTLVQYLLAERLVYGIISDILFFGSLYWGIQKSNSLKEDNE